MQNVNDKLFVLLFLYNKNININREKIEKDVAVYGNVSNIIFVRLLVLYSCFINILIPT